MNVEKAYPDWLYKLIVPLLMGLIITKLDKIEENQRAQAVSLAVHEIRLTHLEKFHPFQPPKIPEVKRPTHLYSKDPSERRGLRIEKD